MCKEKKKNKLGRRILSVMLTFVMALTLAPTYAVQATSPVAGDNWAVNEDRTLGLANTAIDNAVGNMTKGKMVLIGTKGGTISNLPTADGITVKMSRDEDAVLIKYNAEQEISVIKAMLKTIKFSDTTYQAHIDVTNGADNLTVSTTDNTFGILNANDENGEAHAYKYINFTNEQAKNWISAYHHAITGGEKLAGLKGYLATVTSSKEATLLNAFYKVVNPDNTNGGWIAATSLRYSTEKNKSYNEVKNSLVTPDNYENIASPVGDNYKIIGTNGAYYWTTESISSRYCDYYYWACGPEQGQVVTKTLWKSGEPNNSSSKESCTVASYSNTELFNDFPVNNTSVPGYFLEFSAYENGLTDDGKCHSTTIYRILYDGNGATSGNVPAFQSKNKDVDLTLSENTGNLKKDGYQLVGWNTKADGTGTSYQLGGTYNVNAGGKLYAKWELKPEADINEPEPVKGLVATEGNETPIPLVEKGDTTEGTIKYAIGTDPNTPPTEGWSEKVPTATKPGVYYVWSYVEGDEDHNDSTPTCVTVEIFKKKETKDDKKETAEITNDEGDVIETVEQTIIDETEKSVKIVKKDNPDTDMTVKIKITQPSEDTTNDGGIKLSDVSGGTLEYSKDGGKTWESVPASNEITPIGKGEVLVRFKGTDTSEPSSPISVNVTVKDKEPEDTTYADKLDRTVAEFEKLVNSLTDLTDEQKKQYIDQIDAAYTTGKNEIASGKSDEEKAAAYNKAVEAMKSVFSDALKKDIETRADNAKKAIDNTAGLTSKQKADLKAEIDKAATTAIAAIKSAVDTMATNGAKENSGTAHPLKVDSDLVNGILDGLDKDIDAVKTKAKTLSSNGGKVSAKEAKANSMTLNAKLKVDQKGNAISVAWGKVKNADGYNVYVQYCGKKFTKPAKVITSKKICSVKIKKINGKRLNRKKNFKVCVKAYKKVAGKNVEIGKSITAHVVGVLNKEYTNVKDIKITSHTIIDVYTSSPYQITAKTILVDKSKKQLSDEHAKEFRYASSNESIATVSDTGVIKGVKPGKCTIYVYARNGYAKTVKVTVKK